VRASDLNRQGVRGQRQAANAVYRRLRLRGIVIGIHRRLHCAIQGNRRDSRPLIAIRQQLRTAIARRAAAIRRRLYDPGSANGDRCNGIRQHRRGQRHGIGSHWFQWYARHGPQRIQRHRIDPHHSERYRDQRCGQWGKLSTDSRSGVDYFYLRKRPVGVDHHRVQRQPAPVLGQRECLLQWNRRAAVLCFSGTDQRAGPLRIDPGRREH
jgi:hypothetical protein